jgi:hypothetical protein
MTKAKAIGKSGEGTLYKIKRTHLRSTFSREGTLYYSFNAIFAMQNGLTLLINLATEHTAIMLCPHGKKGNTKTTQTSLQNLPSKF